MIIKIEFIQNRLSHFIGKISKKCVEHLVKYLCLLGIHVKSRQFGLVNIVAFYSTANLTFFSLRVLCTALN